MDREHTKRFAQSLCALDGAKLPARDLSELECGGWRAKGLTPLFKGVLVEVRPFQGFRLRRHRRKSPDPDYRTAGRHMIVGPGIFDTDLASHRRPSRSPMTALSTLLFLFSGTA